MYIPGKLGKAPARYEPKAPLFSRHKMASAPPPPKADWTKGYARNDWGLWDNDKLGDCTAVGIGNAFLNWTRHSQPSPLKITTPQIIALYSATTGYDPAVPSTDRGAVEIDVLNYVAKRGFDAGRKDPEVCTFVVIDPKDTVALKNSIAHLGVAYLGLQLPDSAQDQNVWKRTYGADGDDTPGSWGGHCVTAMAYDHDYVRLITWGWTHLATWDWLSVYLDEAYGLLSPDWLDSTGKSPEGLNWDRLYADLQNLLD